MSFIRNFKGARVSSNSDFYTLQFYSFSIQAYYRSLLRLKSTEILCRIERNTTIHVYFLQIENG